MPPLSEIVEAVWSEVINGATARDILAAWLRYLEHQGGSQYRRRGYRSWFFSNWLPRTESAALPQSPIRSDADDDAIVIRRRDTRAAGVPAEGARPDDADSLGLETAREAADALLRAVRQKADASLIRAAGAPQHTTEDDDMEAMVVALLLLEED